MNRELKDVKKLLDANKLALNIEKKNNFVLFHSAVKKIMEPIVLQFGHKKNRANHVEFLGVLLDENETLSWKYHLIELSRKWSRSVGIFYKMRHFVPKEMLKTVYYSLFYLFLSNGIVVWGATPEKYLKPVFISPKKL